MNKYIVSTLLVLLLMSCKTEKKEIKENEIKTEAETTMNVEPIYQFKVEDINGQEFDFATLEGKKIMIVNTASKCGLTPQYKNLQSLYDTYSSDNFVIVGFPANNFLSQEPGSDSDISAFCEQNYGVSFPMMSKISVKGDDMHEVYQYLTTKDLNGLEDSGVTWNFQKFLIDENGRLVRVVSPRTLPDDQSIIDWIKS